MSRLSVVLGTAAIVLCLAGLVVLGLLKRRDDGALLAELERRRDDRATMCQGARARAEVLAGALANPALQLEVVAAARELAAWAPYCGGRRIVISLTHVDVGQLRTDLIDFAKGN